MTTWNVGGFWSWRLIGYGASTQVMDKLLERTVPHWGKLIVDKIPMAVIKKANNVLGPRFITKYGTKQGVLVLGMQVPALVGAAIGGGGNYAFGWMTIRAAKKILGPLPEAWPASPLTSTTRSPFESTEKVEPEVVSGSDG